MKPGAKVYEQINDAIIDHDRLLLILSTESMASAWVATEIAAARKREAAQSRQVLFPISLAPFETLRSWTLFDADRGKDSAAEIREYFIPDFSDWKDRKRYATAFGGLLRALRTKA
jgi:hypothetical protein